MTRDDRLLIVRKLSEKFAYTSIQMHECIGRKMGLTGTDHKYLGFLIQKGRMSAGELSVLTGLTTGAVTGLIDRFEKKKLVKRVVDKNDRRKVLIVPNTKKITSLFDPMYKDFRHNTEVLFASFLPSELDTIERYFGKAIEIIKMRNPNNEKNGNRKTATPFAQTYFHGTKADLQPGDLIEAGYYSNYGQKKAKYIFLTATLDAAIWGAELSAGEGRERIYLVEPSGPIENDPDLTDRKFPGNPTMSYRSEAPFRIVGEIGIWQGHTTEQVEVMKDALKKLQEQGVNSLNDE